MNVKISGISKVISMSKIRNIKLIKKKWILSGIRLLFKGSNPHSKGEDFSRFLFFFFDIIKFKNNKINEINIGIKVKIKKIKIIYIKFFNLNILIGN